MPLIKMHTSTSIAEEKHTGLMGSLSKIVADATGKSEAVVMVTLNHGPIMMAGTGDNAALLDVRGIGGVNKETNTAITNMVCALLEQELNIPPGRVYINFTDIDGTNWGCNSKTIR